MFETEGYTFREKGHADVRASNLIRKIAQMFDDPLKNQAYSFSAFFQKIKRSAHERAEISLSQTRIGSEDEDMEERAIEDEIIEDSAPPQAKRRLRSSGAPEDVLEEPSTSAATNSSFESSASELWDMTKIPFDSVNKEEHDMRGFSNMRGGLTAHKMVLGLLARGQKASAINAAYTRMTECVLEFKGSKVMSTRTIDEKR